MNNLNMNNKQLYLKPIKKSMHVDNIIDNKKVILMPDMSKNKKIFDLLFRAVGLWLLKDKDEMTFNGSQEQVKVLSNVMLATKDFYTYLKSDVEMDIDVMKSLLDRKNMSAIKFEDMFNIKWPF